MVWCVVHFTADDTVEVVPELWYRKEGSCAWPKTSNIKDIKKAVIFKAHPNKHDFSYYEARCLASNIGKHYSKIFIFCTYNKIVNSTYTYIIYEYT